MIDISKLDGENLEKIRHVFKKDKKLKCVIGFAKTLDMLSKYLVDKNDTPEMFGAKIIISCSEVLSETTRTNLKKVFGCSVVSRYSNQENGILAQEPIDSDYFIINRASYHLEFLKLDRDEEAQIGELARIIVTDLFNYATPMIRYDTGDLAIVKDSIKYGKVIKSIEGRKVDIVYDTKEKELSPHAITSALWNYEKIKQYQLIQDELDAFRLKLNGSFGIYKDEDIINTFKSILGQDAKILIEHVEEVPVLESGKFQMVISNYIKQT